MFGSEYNFIDIFDWHLVVDTTLLWTSEVYYMVMFKQRYYHIQALKKLKTDTSITLTLEDKGKATSIFGITHFKQLIDNTLKTYTNFGTKTPQNMSTGNTNPS